MSEPAPPAAGAGSSDRLVTALSFGLVLLIALLLAVWGAFLVPLRLGGVPVPACLVVAAVGNVALGVAGGRLLGTAGAVAPGVVWVVVALMLGSKRGEGDLVVPGTGMGTAFLAVGALAAAVGYGVSSARSRRGSAQALHPDS